MGIAYNDLVDDVCGFLQIRITDKDKFRVDISLNRAQDHLLGILQPRHLVNAIRTWRGHLVNGEPAYQWPADFRRFLKMWVDFDNSISKTNMGYPAIPVGDTELWDVANIDLLPDKQHPKVSLGIEGGFELQPTPTQNVTEGWRLRYVAVLPKISESQQCILHARLRNVLTFYATSLSALVEEFSMALHKEFKDYYKEELEQLQPKAQVE